jgi:hypothetical protein
MQQVTFPLQLLASRVATAAGTGRSSRAAAGEHDRARCHAAGRRGSMQRNPLASDPGHAGHHLRLPDGDSEMGAGGAGCSAVPIAVAANSFRVFGTGLLVQYWDPDKAEGFFHTFEGWLIFVVALIMLFAVHRLISLVWKTGPAVAQWKASQRRRNPHEGQVSSLWDCGCAHVGHRARAAGPFAHRVLSAARASEFPAPRKLMVGREPTTPRPADARHPRARASFWCAITKTRSQPQPWINLYIAYFPTQKAGDTIHSPNHCLPGAGWVPTSREWFGLRPDGSSFPVNRYVVSKAGERQLVLYWFQAHGRAGGQRILGQVLSDCPIRFA